MFRPVADRAAWANSVLAVPPWSPAEGQLIVEGLRSAIVAELMTAPADQGLISAEPAIFRACKG